MEKRDPDTYVLVDEQGVNQNRSVVAYTASEARNMFKRQLGWKRREGRLPVGWKAVKVSQR